MKTQKQNTLSRLTLSVLAAMAIAACSDKSSPTGASPLPPAQGFGNAQASTSAEPAPPIGDPAARPLPSYTCADFGDVRLRVFARDNDVVVQYAAERVPLDAFYYVRFWPEGRHRGTPIDEVIGDLRAGDAISGEFVAMTFGDIDRKITLDYNVDIEMVLTEDAYQRGETDVGQCDRGGELELLPPVEPPRCDSSVSIGDLRHRVVNQVVYVRFEVDVHAKNFTGYAELEWTTPNNPVIVTTQLNADCDGETATLVWEPGQGQTPHGTFVVRVFDDTGRLVKSRSYHVDDLRS